MATITLEEAQTHLGEIIHRLTPGEELVITENNRPVARLIPTQPEPAAPTPRKFGTLRGTVGSMEHFDDPLEDFAEYM
jgi:prevent-host-death family protein